MDKLLKEFLKALREINDDHLEVHDEKLFSDDTMKKMEKVAEIGMDEPGQLWHWARDVKCIAFEAGDVFASEAFYSDMMAAKCMYLGTAVQHAIECMERAKESEYVDEWDFFKENYEIIV